MFENDPEYRKLLDEYNKAKNAFKIAAEHRMRVRKMMQQQKAQVPPARRPVGSPVNAVIPSDQFSQAGQGSIEEKEFRIYMGNLLGWVKFLPSPTLMPLPDPAMEFDINKTFDNISLGLFWNAKIHYKKCKDALERYIPKEKYVKQEIEIHRNRARDALNYQANLQLLGVESEGEFLGSVHQEVEAACKVALVFYQKSPEPKSKGAIVVLLENLADSQFVGLESETTRRMNTEVNILINTRRLRKE